jgi:hypothetical protein
MFQARTIYLDPQRQETAAYDLAPVDPEGQRVCALWAEFLAQRPPEFREKLPFIQRDLELEWTAAPGGVALASFYTSESPCSMAILLAGVDPEADRAMLNAWRRNVLAPLLGEAAANQVEADGRPLLLSVVFPQSPELTPALQLMGTALASVYFRCARQSCEAASAAPPAR